MGADPHLAAQWARTQPLGRRHALIDDNACNGYIVRMATLNIRNLPDDVHRRLRIRAAEHGRSMEAEARAILTKACGDGPRPSPEDREAAVRRLQAYVRRVYGNRKPDSVVDAFLEERRRDWDRE